ncbi:MAG: HDIG domain-containing protein [Bacteroidales bacterium]|nr:HDIG domain-containing protein [Bacteroidales bacterium]
MPQPAHDPWSSVKTRKDILNLFMFLASIAVVVALLSTGIRGNPLALTGIIIIVSSCYLVLFLFLWQFRREVLEVGRKTFFIILSILTLLLVTRYVLDRFDRNVLFLIPYAIIPVIIRTFYDARLALFIHLITIMLAGFMIPQSFTLIFMSFISGMIAIFTLTNIYRKTRLLITAFIVFLSYSVLYFGISLMLEGNLADIEWKNFGFFAGNGILILVSFPLIFLFENKFLLLSDTTLLQLADTSQPLLRKLADDAPGSFQHSLQVANLAEEAARVTGASLLLVKTGALYHDIGKIANPKYFIENQAEGISPHENLNPRESSRLIINHVKNGVNLAKNYKVPVQIIDFIRTHHGTSVAYYFYKKFLDLNPGITGIEKEFAYPGPKPFSVETAIVMMADAVEASSRSLEDYTEENISELVERILYIQEQDGQFAGAPLTYKNISDIKDVFKKRLSNIYHARIAYPERG